MDLEELNFYDEEFEGAMLNLRSAFQASG